MADSESKEPADPLHLYRQWLANKREMFMSFAVVFCHGSEHGVSPEASISLVCWMWVWVSIRAFDCAADDTREKKTSPFSYDLTTRSMILHVFFRVSVPGVMLLLERFGQSLRSTILLLWDIKKISSINVNYLGGKSLSNSDLAHNWLLNFWDCQDCINPKINKDQRLEKIVGVTGLTWVIDSKREKNLKHPGQNCSLRQCWE